MLDYVDKERRKTNRTFSNKLGNMKDEINEFEINTNNNNITRVV